MRRLAKQRRDDAYTSLRDYQDTEVSTSSALRVAGFGPHRLVLRGDIVEGTNTPLVAFGGFLQPSADVMLGVRLEADGNSVEHEFPLGEHWNRVGLAIEAPGATSLTVTLEWEGAIDMNVWGLSGGAVNLPTKVVEEGYELDELNKTHLAPETFYLLHESALDLEVDLEHSNAVDFEPGSDITLKKCSYCSRHLPLDPDRPGTLSFHKHNAKVSNHQNECRSCKKWRINDNFNPKRTVDQLNESSVITRERKLFLREPQLLQELKERTGSGLKSQVWERFDRRCFYCKKLLALAEVQLDHTRPLAYLWPLDEYATCLCAEHNNQKQDKFPIDFYSLEQLNELSAITGLSLDKLQLKVVNEDELARILHDIVAFAKQWEPRTFAANARKIREMHPEVDLFAVLEAADPEIYAELLAEVESRPPAIGDA